MRQRRPGALAFAKTHPKTLIVVTADHAHSSQIVESGSEIQGLGSILTTKKGVPMELSYGTASKGGSQSHTGAQVRAAARCSLVRTNRGLTPICAALD